MDGDVRSELLDLAARYAQALDQRNAEQLRSVFAPAGRLVVYIPADAEEPSSVFPGHEHLGEVTDAIENLFEHTFHFVGNATYAVAEGDTMTGEVYCIAHHFMPGADGKPSNLVMYIRYEDTYQRSSSGWIIANRVIRVVRQELRPTL